MRGRGTADRRDETDGATVVRAETRFHIAGVDRRSAGSRDALRSALRIGHGLEALPLRSRTEVLADVRRRSAATTVVRRDVELRNIVAAASGTQEQGRGAPGPAGAPARASCSSYLPNLDERYNANGARVFCYFLRKTHGLRAINFLL